MPNQGKHGRLFVFISPKWSMSASMISSKCHRESGCGYFQWADELPAAAAAGMSSGAAAAYSNRGNFGSNNTATGSSSARKPPPRYLGPADASAVTGPGGVAGASECACKCGAPAITQLTRKEGPNMGRLFFACRKKRYEIYSARSSMVCLFTHRSLSFLMSQRRRHAMRFLSVG